MTEKGKTPALLSFAAALSGAFDGGAAEENSKLEIRN
jgi:hypothetical protein